MVGESGAIREVGRLIERVAGTDTTVLMARSMAFSSSRTLPGQA
jgi:hypothetical protein